MESIDSLVGAHAEALAEIYANGEPATAEELGDKPRGRFLSFVPTSSLHLLLRPLVRVISTTLMPWQGVQFDHGGNAGANVFSGKPAMRFRAERAASALDGMQAMVLTYDGQPWPFKHLRDEARMVAEGLAIGPTFVKVGDSHHLLAWFGLTSR